MPAGVLMDIVHTSEEDCDDRDNDDSVWDEGQYLNENESEADDRPEQRWQL